MSSWLQNGYLVLLGLLACYGVYRYYLLWLYYRFKSRPVSSPPPPAVWPHVTIQIPVYNERYVVERAIRSACEVDYPRDRLEVQLLDDSTDETSDIIARAIAPYRRQGLRVTHLRRADRRDFKAGALADGLRCAAGEFLAVFDADFVVPREFLTRTIPFFQDSAIAMVQSRWGHLNADYSLLTRVQALLLDGHFAIEQVARHRAGQLLSFNGTGGVWRKSAILDAGGWQADTLTEDLDLSYRAQLAGWRGVFLPDLVSPAELPVEMNGFKVQQYRWTRGSIQTAKKLLLQVLRSRFPWSVKLEAVCHLTCYFCYPLGLLASLGILPFAVGHLPWPHRAFVDAVWFVLLTVSGACFYLCAQWELYDHWIKRSAFIPWSVAVAMGLSVNNALAVVGALWGRSASFIRTPKFGIQSKDDVWKSKGYRAPRSVVGWVELALGAYFLVAALWLGERREWSTLPFLLLFAAGFVYVGWWSLWEGRSLSSILRAQLSEARLTPSGSPLSFR